MNDWNYGDAYLRYPIQNGIAVFDDRSMLKTHDLFNPLPEFMKQADIIFTDPPWNQGNMTSFYTKADLPRPNKTYEMLYKRLFECIGEISPRICYIEIGKQYLADIIMMMRKQYKYVTFYNSTYYHKTTNLCYIVRGSEIAHRPSYDGMDEADIVAAICRDEQYKCIGDLCMGRGLVAIGAYSNGKRFVGTELNHKRLSVTIERIVKLGGSYNIQDMVAAKNLKREKTPC